jgi:uncharacterized protein (DUF58 family)
VIPRPPLIALGAIPVALAVLVIWSNAAIPVLLAFDVALVLLAGLDLLGSAGDLAGGRQFDAIQAVGREFPVKLWVDNRGRRDLVVRVTDAAPDQTDGLPGEAILPRGRRLELDYRARIGRRGQHAFGPITVRWRSPLGLWERQRHLPCAGSVRVYPDFEQLRRLDLETRLVQERAPVRSRRRPGGENEFERLRPYVPGDPMKHIDWKATARRRELVTREYGQEANQNVLFLLDCGRTMGGRSGELLAFDHALNATVMMGEVALRHGDRVGVLAFDSRIRAWIPPLGGSRSGARLIRGIYDLAPSIEDPDYALAFRHLGQRVRRRSLVVLLTSMVDEPSAEQASALISSLARRHLVIAVWLRDPTIDGWVRDPGDDALAPFRRGAAAELVGWREKALALLRRKGALVVDCPHGELTPQLVASYLEIKARRLLA